MEGALQSLIHFLNRIYEAQSETDSIRVRLLSQVGAKRKIFLTIDQSCRELITSDDIVEFCRCFGSQCLQPFHVQQDTAEIIGRYFRNWHEGITFEQFAQTLKPKNFTGWDQSQQSQSQEPLQQFYDLVNLVIRSFKDIELLRKDLSQNYQHIINYFQTSYGVGRKLTKQNLKNFMINSNSQSRHKFTRISNYIFGETETEIPWESFLKSSSEFSEKIIPIVQQQMEHSQEVETVTHVFKNIRTQPKAQIKCTNIHQVMSQIEQIEKSMHDKKLRNTFTHQDKQKVSIPSQGRQGLIGKVVSRQNSKKILQTDVKIHEQQIEKLKDRANILAYDNLDVGVEKPIKSTLHRTPSQAQLKLEQIEKRAMDKYLNSRRAQYLPNDSCVPYYHVGTRGNEELARQRSIDSNRANIKYGAGQIYTRNRATRMLMDDWDGHYFVRPMSPHLLRY